MSEHVTCSDMYIASVNVLDMVHSEYFYFNKSIS